jgi:preprotein translocase subunit YajC
VLLAADQSAGSSSFYTLGLIVLFGLAVYFLMIRPQNKRRRDAMSMQSTLGPGDEIQTVGGLFGTVVSVDGDEVTIEASPGVELRFVRGAIARVVTKVHEDEADSPAETDNSDAAKTIEQA